MGAEKIFGLTRRRLEKLQNQEALCQIEYVYGLMVGPELVSHQPDHGFKLKLGRLANFCTQRPLSLFKLRALAALR